MTYSEFVASRVKPGQDIVDTMSASKANTMHMLMGLAGESLELYKAITASDVKNIREELGDFGFFLEGLGQELGFLPFATPAIVMLYDLEVLIDCADTLLDLAKRVGIYNKELDREELFETLTIVRSICRHTMASWQLTWPEIEQGNMAKLTKRYSSGKYSDKQAQERADKATE
jgi:hypothetical protein